MKKDAKIVQMKSKEKRENKFVIYSEKGKIENTRSDCVGKTLENKASVKPKTPADLPKE